MKNIHFLLPLILLTSALTSAQTSSQANVPTELQSEQKVFLANGGAPALSVDAQKGSNVLYTRTFQALSSIRRFHMVSSPTQANLTIVVSLQSNTESKYGSTTGDPLIRLEITDVKTHALLWVLDDPASSAFGSKQFEKSIDTSLRRIVTELDSLGSGVLR